MSYQTDERIKNYLDTNQLYREQMCRAILATDKRFSDVRPRHPHGGPDGGRDIEAIFRDDQITFGAVGFINQANDSSGQKRTIKKKFVDDLNSAIESDISVKVFIFFTNINLTISEKESLIEKAKVRGIFFCEVFDRERIRIALDSPDGFSIRFQYLGLTLSEEEQASFFSKWGDDIQSVISSGFKEIESTLSRILFLQEANYSVENLTVSFELNKRYCAEEIGHFRSFCDLFLKEPKNNVFSILFGSSDKSNRMSPGNSSDFSPQKSGIKYGVSAGKWERRINSKRNIKNKVEWTQIGSSSSIGVDEVEFISINYSQGSLFRFGPTINLRDLDDAMFVFLVNKSLADKIKEISVYSNGYKLLGIDIADFYIDGADFNQDLPVLFNEDEIKDSWVKIRPKYASVFNLRFFESTPKRMFIPSKVESSIKVRNV